MCGVSVIVAVGLSVGCWNHGGKTIPDSSVKEVATKGPKQALQCHEVVTTGVSLNWPSVSNHFHSVLTTVGHATDTVCEQSIVIARGQDRRVVVGVRATVGAANTTFVQTHLPLIRAARPIVVEAIERLFSQPRVKNGILWDDRELLDRISQIG